jgi:hypothetical protein
MIGVTLFGILLTPVFAFVLLRSPRGKEVETPGRGA